MSRMLSPAAVCVALSLVFSPVSQAKPGGNCPEAREPDISFVEYPSIDNPLLPAEQQMEITVKGKLKLPVRCNSKRDDRGNSKHRGRASRDGLPAVLILHGTGGVDSRGDFYARALNDAGIATLEIDFWEARGVTGVADRPQLPIFTYPDAFGGLAFLSEHPMIDPDGIGVLGFSWGGIMSLASAEQTYAAWFGQGRSFAAHAAHYPVCYGANNEALFPDPLNPTIAGTLFKNLTGAPVLIQIGTEDDYDNDAEPCLSLADGLDPVEVVVYEGAYHAWDRLQVPVNVQDPFGDEGRFLFGETQAVPLIEIVPDVDQAYESRREIVDFFATNL